MLAGIVFPHFITLIFFYYYSFFFQILSPIWAEFPGLYSRSLLVIHFKHSSVYIGGPHMAWHSFTELDKLWSGWSNWPAVCNCGFSLSALWCPLSVPTILLRFLLPWTWGISSWLQQSAAPAPYLGCGVAPVQSSSCRSSAVMQLSWWKGLTECGPLEKGIANNFSILALRTSWTIWKSKKIGHWKMNSPGQ